MRINRHFKLLKQDFSEKIAQFRAENPQIPLIDLGFSCHYGEKNSMDFAADEVFFVGSVKAAMAGILQLFNKSTAMISNPYFPPFLEANIVAGNAVIFAEGNSENGFLPLPDGRACDLIYLASPSNPTGAAYDYDKLKIWIDYAKFYGAILLFDATNSCYINNETRNLPKSVFEVEGAEDCSIEFRAYKGGCGCVIIPRKSPINMPFRRYYSYAFDRISPPDLDENLQSEIALVRENSEAICNQLNKNNLEFCGEKNSPFIWVRCPNGLNGDRFFDYLLKERHIISVSGSVFGDENYLRLNVKNLAKANVTKIFE